MRSTSQATMLTCSRCFLPLCHPLALSLLLSSRLQDVFSCSRISLLLPLSVTYSHTSITCACCCDDIKETQDLKMWSHAVSLPLSCHLLPVCLSVPVPLSACASHSLCGSRRGSEAAVSSAGRAVARPQGKWSCPSTQWLPR
jgi:hypothetical protein